ncbi:MAG: hypothetical protein QOJ86_1810 [Bradyrhizobium sp.]|jgi:hypothetical protein|nr:hypothetical protein [Bradyrhizobium sp.]
MATLTVTGTHDYGSAPLTNIDSIVFATSSGATATFRSDQFGPGLISNNVAISGDAHQNVIQVSAVAPGAFSAAQWTFGNWGSSDQPSFADGVVLLGSPDAGGKDTITGSSQGDVIWASSSAFPADDGADSLSGGAGDDVFRIHRGSSYTLFDGGPGTDTIWVFSQLTDQGSVDLSNSTIVSVERLRLAASLASATLRGDQIGGPGKIQEVEGYPTDFGPDFLRVNGAHVDLSTVTFVNSGQRIQINGTSASGNTLIGSSQSDVINAFDGSSGDIWMGAVAAIPSQGAAATIDISMRPVMALTPSLDLWLGPERRTKFTLPESRLYILLPTFLQQRRNRGQTPYSILVAATP